MKLPGPGAAPNSASDSPAIMLLAGDLISQTIMAPAELPVRVITAAAGSVFVLGLVMHRMD